MIDDIPPILPHSGSPKDTMPTSSSLKTDFNSSIWREKGYLEMTFEPKKFVFAEPKLST